MGRNALHGPLRYHLALCVGRYATIYVLAIDFCSEI